MILIQVNPKFYILTVLFMTSLLINNGSTQTATVNFNQEFQTIRGFGGMNHTSWISDLNEDQRAKAFGNDPGQLGLNILRIHISPNSASWNAELPTARYAKSKGAIVFASPWDPPSNLLDADAAFNRIPPDKYGDYADHLNAFSSYMANNSASLYAVSIQNEPDYGEQGGWTDWTAEEMVNFLRSQGGRINNKVIAPESFQFIRSFSDAILNDGVARDQVDVVGGHIYGGGLFEYPLAKQYDKEVWMTEHYTSSDRSANLWPDALGVGKEIHDCMDANFNAYIWWYIRRFYGLISDDGNISKRGYVFSHFSKFIRSGYQRIAVDNNSNLDISAYKQGSSTLVIVVINRNATAENLTLTIDGVDISTLTKVTTSREQNMVNEGVIELSGNGFTSEMAPFSISTFTTNASKVGKAGNELPIAMAGDPVSVTDVDIDGFEPIILDASLSTDNDGEIQNYSWALEGEQIGFQMMEEVSLPIGNHEVILTITDDDGGRSTDTLFVEVKADESVVESEYWFDAECTTVGSNWQIRDDASVSNGKFVSVNPGTQSLEQVSSDAADYLVFEFEVPQNGNYRVWGHVRVPSPDDDSFWVRMDDGAWRLWNSITGGAFWGWDDIHDSNAGGDATIYELSQGMHKLYISYREDGADLDKILIVNNSNVPSGNGEADENCTGTSVNDLLTKDLISVFPNPVKNGLNINSEMPFDQLRIYSQTGQNIEQRIFTSSINNAFLEIDVPNGLYFLEIVGEQRVTRKIVVNK